MTKTMKNRLFFLSKKEERKRKKFFLSTYFFTKGVYKWATLDYNSGVKCNKVVDCGRYKVVKGMYMGEYRHHLDAKGRLILPSKFRDTYGDHVIVARGIDGCLDVYSTEAWEEHYQKIASMPQNRRDYRAFVRLMTSQASDCEIDKQGRINIPDRFLKEAHIQKECVILGVGNHVEVWAKDLWEHYYGDNKDQLEDILEELDGFY